MSASEIPHNVVIVKSGPLVESDSDSVSDKPDTLRAFIFARKSSQGNIS